jgi:hypothetical protein
LIPMKRLTQRITPLSIFLILLSFYSAIKADQESIGEAPSEIEPSLCEEKYDAEKHRTKNYTVFSCKAGNKIISYCLTTAKPQLTSPDDGYLSFRLSEQANTKIVYPQAALTIGEAFNYASLGTGDLARNPRNRFNSIKKIQDFEMKNSISLPENKFLAELSFLHDDYRYTLWLITMSPQEILNENKRSVGLVVEYKDKVVEDLWCDNPMVGSYAEIFENQVFDTIHPLYAIENRGKQSEFRGVSPYIRSKMLTE